MRKILFTLFLSFSTVLLFAQGFGVRAGINISNVSIKSQGISIKPSANVGPNAGIFANFKVALNLSLQPELAYSAMGYKVDVDGVSGTETTSYLTLPLLVKFKVPMTGLGIYAGPQYGLLLSAKDKSDGETQDAKDSYKSSDVAAVFGAEYALKLGLFFSARYQAGLTNVAKTDQGDNTTAKNNSVTLLVGFKF